jgi:tripartite-type tricarboxylate transporter receptor subunit TctC
MQFRSRIFSAALTTAIAIGGAALDTQVHAQGNYPSKPITIIVPYGAGGTNDILARSVAAKMSESMGQPVIVENKPGAGGNIGAALVAKAPADGYTVLTASSGILAIAKWIYSNPGYDAQRDFAPLTLAGSVPNVLLVHPSVQASNVKELTAYAKTNPGKLSFASMGTGTSGHLSAELFKMMAEVAVLHVPYKGSAPALNDLLGGHVQLMFDNLPTALPQVKSGKLRAFAVTSAKRSPLLPDVPTLAEAGVKDFEATAWFGFVAPAATPPAILDRLNHEMVKALNDPALRAALGAQGVTIVANSRAEFAKIIADESVKWRKVVERSGAKVD